MTVKFSFSVGLVVRRGDRLFEFDRRLEDNTLIFVDQIDKSPRRWQMSTVYRDLQDGKLHVVHGNQLSSDSKDEGLPLITDINSLPEKHRNKVTRQIDYVHALRRQGLGRGMRRAVEGALPALIEKFNDTNPPSVSTVLSWWRRLERNGNVINSLISRHLGKRPPKRKGWASPIIRKTLRLEYCTRERKTIDQVTRSINTKLREAASQHGVTAAEATVSHSTVRRYISEISPYVLDKARYGASYAKNKWRYSLAGTNCVRALQRYEIDHTIVDLVVICDRTNFPLGRPTITVVIDSYSSYVVGFFVSFWGSGLATTFSALKVAFAPKDGFAAALQKVENPWLGMGICELLVMDNGLEFHSPQLRSVAQHLDMDLLFCPVRTPWLKPTVERALGSMNCYLPSQGRVEKRLDNYIPINPDKTAAVTFSALCEGLLMAFVDLHANQINDQKLARPFDLMQESLLELPPPCLPGPMHQLEIIVGESTTKTVGNEGVVMNYLRYNSSELQQLRRTHGHKFSTEVRYDPGNLSQVYVKAPDSANWLLVPSCMPAYTADLSAVQHRAIRQFAKGDLQRRGAYEALLRAKQNLEDHWSSSVRVGKRLQSKQLKALSGLTSAHVLDTHQRSTETTAVPQVVTAPICELDMAAFDEAPPLFDTMTFM